MKKKVICFLSVCLLMAMNTAFASNWVEVERRSDPSDVLVRVFQSPFSRFIDADNVVKDGSRLVFWEKLELDKPFGSQFQAALTKYEANLSTQQYRKLEFRHFDTQDHEVNVGGQAVLFTIDNMTFYEPWLGHTQSGDNLEWMGKEIHLALPYAKQGQDTGVASYETMRFQYEYRLGRYVRVASGIVRDPQGLWQALLPLQPPPGARGSYGLIGDDHLLGKESGFGLRQLGSVARRYILFDSFYIKQPQGFSGIGVQSGESTSVDAMNDTTLGWVLFDLRPYFEADLKQRFHLAP